MDWVEFTTEAKEKISIRAHYINTFREYNGGTALFIEDGDESVAQVVEEPYEQVKQKIMDAEKVDLSNVVVEHFTKEEYDFIRQTIEFFTGALDENMYVKVLDKLNEILKEKE